MKKLLLTLAVLMASLCSLVPPAAADATPTCSSDADLYAAHQFCHYSGDQFQALITTASSNVTYSIKPMCVETQDVEDDCINQQPCEAPPDTFRYMVFRSTPGEPNVPWGTVCLRSGEIEVEVITPDRVLAEMKKLDWPEAELSIQPPGGKTLINFETNFFTETTHSTTQAVTLLGQQVDIEATPVEYTWHFGDGESSSGADPGAPYPALTVTHVYREADEVSPSVDVTYQGRYRVNGGEWQDIPQTLTVEGTAVDLQVVTATPRLVG